MNCKTIITLTMLIAGGTCAAQLTLNDCLIYARDHAHANIISNLEEKKASIDRRISASALMPYVELSSSGNISFGRNIDPETNTYDNKQTLYTGFGLQMSLPLFDGLAGINTLKAARMASLRQRNAACAQRDRTSLAVVNAFYNVAYCRAMVEMMEQQLQRDTRTLTATERDEATGFKSGADVAEMKAMVASDMYELTNQRNLLAKAYLQLRAAMGLPVSEEPLELADTEDTPDLPPAADVGWEHPEIAEARMAVDESHYRLKAAKGAFSPKISFSAGISTSYYKMLGSDVTMPRFSRQWHDNMGQYVGFSFSLPLFSGLGTLNRVKRARIDVMQQQAQLDLKRDEIAQATTEANLDWLAANDEYDAAHARVEAEQLAYNAVKRKFELGNSSAIDLYTAATRLATARANLEGKRIRRIISRITLGYYRGENLIKENIQPKNTKAYTWTER